jgi:hypothetical protein
LKRSVEHGRLCLKTGAGSENFLWDFRALILQRQLFMTQKNETLRGRFSVMRCCRR